MVEIGTSNHFIRPPVSMPCVIQPMLQGREKVDSM